MGTRSTASGETLTGPYSRFGFHHPGPAYFLLRIPLYYLTSFAASSSYLTVSLISISCLAGMYSVILRRGSPFTAVLFCLACAAWMRTTTHQVWLSDWNAFVIAIPVLFVFVSLCAVLSGGSGWLAPAVAAGSFAAQTHLGCIPTLLAAFSAVAISFPVRRMRAPEGMKRALLASGVVAMFFWLPVLVQQLWGPGEGNMGALAAFLAEARPRPETAVVVREWACNLVNLETLVVPLPLVRRLGILTELNTAVIVARLVLLFACQGMLRKARPDSFFRQLGLLAVLAHAMTFLSAFQVREELHQFLLVWCSVLAPLSWLAIAGGLWDASGKPGPGTAATLAALAVAGTLSVPNVIAGSGASSWPAVDSRVEALSPLLAERIDSDGLQETRIVLGDHALWDVMAGLANDLQKQGYSIQFDRAFSFMSGIEPSPGAVPVQLGSDSLWIPGYTEFAAAGGAVLGVRSP